MRTATPPPLSSLLISLPASKALYGLICERQEERGSGAGAGRKPTLPCCYVPTLPFQGGGTHWAPSAPVSRAPRDLLCTLWLSPECFFSLRSALGCQ